MSTARRLSRPSGTRGVPNGQSLSKRLGALIVKDIREGLPTYLSGARHGVPKGTMIEWLARGAGRDPDRPAKPIYAWFAEEVEKAKAERTKLRIKSIEHHAVTDWRSTAWLMERTDPENWGQRATVDHAGEVSHRVIVEMAFDHTTLRANVRRRLEAGGVIDVEPTEEGS